MASLDLSNDDIELGVIDNIIPLLCELPKKKKKDFKQIKIVTKRMDQTSRRPFLIQNLYVKDTIRPPPIH